MVVLRNYVGRAVTFSLLTVLLVGGAESVRGQGNAGTNDATTDEAAVVQPEENPSANTHENDSTSAASESNQGSESEGIAEDAQEKASEVAEDTRNTVEDVAGRIDQDPRAKEAAAGILQPIYRLAEAMAFPAFYWLAFAMMTAGVVSFAFQLVLAKLAVLFKGGLNIREILSDAVGLLISTVGLVLTTQAATENSTFTQSAAGVLSATVVGAVLGLLLYSWGQSQELRAVDGQKIRHLKTSRKNP